uniref:Uncharacterized protein n=1 Tax=Vitrella brassicaformis TaxID=1169539 RepID=A0A7S1P458_9ALVE
MHTTHTHRHMHADTDSQCHSKCIYLQRMCMGNTVSHCSWRANTGAADRQGKARQEWWQKYMHSSPQRAAGCQQTDRQTDRWTDGRSMHGTACRSFQGIHMHVTHA